MSTIVLETCREYDRFNKEIVHQVGKRYFYCIKMHGQQNLKKKKKGIGILTWRRDSGALNLSSGNQNVHVINFQLLFYSLFRSICLLCCILLYYIIFIHPDIIFKGYINIISLHTVVYVNNHTWHYYTAQWANML